MQMLITKYAVTALIVVLVSELAKRSDRLGAIISSLPLVTIMIMVWLHVERQGAEKIANHAFFTFWYVIPTLPMFLAMPWLLHRGISFWSALGSCVILTALCFLGAVYACKRLGIELIP